MHIESYIVHELTIHVPIGVDAKGFYLLYIFKST